MSRTVFPVQRTTIAHKVAKHQNYAFVDITVHQKWTNLSLVLLERMVTVQDLEQLKSAQIALRAGMCNLKLISQGYFQAL